MHPPPPHTHTHTPSLSLYDIITSHPPTWWCPWGRCDSAYRLMPFPHYVRSGNPKRQPQPNLCSSALVFALKYNLCYSSNAGLWSGSVAVRKTATSHSSSWGWAKWTQSFSCHHFSSIKSHLLGSYEQAFRSNKSVWLCDTQVQERASERNWADVLGWGDNNGCQNLATFVCSF